MLSFVHALVAPMQAVLRAQRALLAASIDRLRALWPRARGQAPVLFELPLPRPAALGLQLHVPAAALTPPTALSLSRAQVDYVWQLDQISRPHRGSRGAAPQLMGRVAPPARRRRLTDRRAGIQVELVLRREDSTEGLLRLQQAAGLGLQRRTHAPAARPTPRGSRR